MNGKIPKCKECEYHRYKSQNGWDKERHYCLESSKLSIGSFIKANEYKTSPKWCPKRHNDNLNIPETILNKIEKLKNIRNEANDIESDIFKWFEDNGIDTGAIDFADDIGSKISYGEFTKRSEINDLLQKYLNKSVKGQMSKNEDNNLGKGKYVLEAIEQIGDYGSDGYYTGKSYVYQGGKYAVVDKDIKKAKTYSSEARALNASRMTFENYEFKAIKFNA